MLKELQNLSYDVNTAVCFCRKLLKGAFGSFIAAVWFRLRIK